MTTSTKISMAIKVALILSAVMLQSGCWALWLAKQIDQCPVGSQDCPCSEDNACVNDLQCISGTCQVGDDTPAPSNNQTTQLPNTDAPVCQGLPIEQWRERGGTFSNDGAEAFEEPSESCTPSWLTSGIAHAYHLDGSGERYAGGPILAVEFRGGVPVALNGMACVPVAAQGYDRVKAGTCERRYLCGCCGISLEPSEHTAQGASIEEANYVIDAWSAADSSARQCAGIPRTGEYVLDTPTPFSASSMREVGAGSAACQSCLSQCSQLEGGGVASCCVGSTCLCERECEVTTCPEASERCCGEDGYCTCAEDSAPFQCPWPS